MYKAGDDNDGKTSDCCGAEIRLDTCTECHEHCEAVEE